MPIGPAVAHIDNPPLPLKLPHTPQPPNVDHSHSCCGGPRHAVVCLVSQVVRGSIDGYGSDVGDSGEGEGVEVYVVLDDVVFDPGGATDPAVD